MNVVHKITGYDKATHFLVDERDVDATMFSEVRDYAHVEPADTDAMGSYPLPALAISQLNDRFEMGLDSQRFDWFLEPVEG